MTTDPTLVQLTGGAVTLVYADATQRLVSNLLQVQMRIRQRS